MLSLMSVVRVNSAGRFNPEHHIRKQRLQDLFKPRFRGVGFRKHLDVLGGRQPACWR